MRRLLILGIAITAFAFSLFLMNCGPVANNNNGGVNAPGNSQLPVKLDEACTNNPNVGGLKRAILAAVRGNTILNRHYDNSNPDLGSIDLKVVPDTEPPPPPAPQGFVLEFEGDLSHQALEEFRSVIENFVSPTCIRRVRIVPRGHHSANNANNANGDNSRPGGGQAFEWNLICEDPNHPCADGSCAANGASCPAYRDENTNANGNRNANTNTPANRSTNTNSRGNFKPPTVD